jgi:superoxide dismutase
MTYNDILQPIVLKERYFLQFDDYLSEKQMSVHFIDHYLKYLSNTNIFIKKNMDIYKNIISLLPDDNINVIKMTYMMSPRNIFLQLLSKQYTNISEKNNISQVFFHELFFTSITTKMNSLQYFNTYMEDIFGNQKNVEEFYKTYIDIGKKHFASGWLCFLYDNGKLFVIDTPDAIIPEGNIVTCVDLWEHSYYIDYLWNREDYLKKIFLLLNWKNIKIIIDYYKKKY